MLLHLNLLDWTVNNCICKTLKLFTQKYNYKKIVLNLMMNISVNPILIILIDTFQEKK